MLDELSVDRTTAARSKARAKVQRKEQESAAARAEAARTAETVARAQSALGVTLAQLADVVNALETIESKARSIDANDQDAIRWLASEREQTQIRRLALEGRKQREDAQLGDVQAEASAASDAAARAGEAVQKARDEAASAEQDAQEARLVADNKPLPLQLAERRAWRQRMEEQDQLRAVRWCWAEVDRLWARHVPPAYSRDEFEQRKGMLFDRVCAARPGEPSAEEVRGVVSGAEPLKSSRGGSGDTPRLASGEQRWATGAPAPFNREHAPATTVIGGTEEAWDPFTAEE